MENSIDIQEEISLKLNLNSQNLLRIASKWSRFLGIIGFIGSGFIALMAFSMGTIMSALDSATGSMIGLAPSLLLTITYLVIGGVYFVLSYFLFQFGNKAKEAVENKDEMVLEKSILNLKQFFMINGIIIIVYFGLIVLMFLAAIAFGIGSML